MANPAPTISQINAFNVTQGTVIDFNIIGGTDLVRSNKIYIYDLSDNSLICTHLYVSTESIHELPVNTDASIVYASGKSSADFVNNKQYYAQIQTFTDTVGGQGGSGLSVAKLFWCLPTPTLTINTIPASIQTTSYNVRAIYNTNITSQDVTISNVVQQYQFNLYNGTGTLVQTSGVVVGMGTQQGTSTIYNLTYNFTGLETGNAYYVTLQATTIEGMILTATSNAFVISIDTPTLGQATVINNACDGYISVVSNLSGSYSSAISKVLVKRRDVNDTSGEWLTLYAQPITNASSMNFIFVDFFNQYGKTYEYALVPITTQTQSGVLVEIEGGYTISQPIDSIFDGVFIVDNTGSQRLKAGASYGSMRLNQQVSVINTLGSQYPIIVTNSEQQYHNGSISARIVPTDFYSDHGDRITTSYGYLTTSTYAHLCTNVGDRLVAYVKVKEILDRMDMVQQREILEKFLTNKSPKILKDWNGNIWLIMITDGVDITFDNNWGMGMATFSSNWTEIRDPTNQQDLQATGLINVGGV